MDVEELRVTYYDWMRMTGRLLMTIRSEPSCQGQNIPILRLQMEAVVCLTIKGNGTLLVFNDLTGCGGRVEDLQALPVCPLTRSLLVSQKKKM